MGLGISLQVTHSKGQHPPFARAFERCPVLVGRDNSVAACVLPDERISRVHVSFDIRDQWIVARDTGSMNGTWIGGQRVPTDRWVVVGPRTATSEVRIGEWVLLVSAREVATAPVSSLADFLVQPPPPTAPPADLNVTVVAEPLDPRQVSARAQQQKTQVNSGPALRVARVFAQTMAARKELLTTLGEAIDGAPPADRPAIVREILQHCAGLEREPGVHAIFERNGIPVPHTQETASVLALQELARWYVGQKPLASPNDVLAFARKLKVGIDELLLGILPMFSGLDRFEDQMALRGPPQGPGDRAASSRLARAPRDAARELFDWTDRTDDAVRAIRTDIVELTLHQVAVLNGVMRGVKQLLFELAPDQIEKKWQLGLQKRSALSRIFGGLSAAAGRWKLYRERHGDLADEENEQFRVIFGPEFVAEYKSSSADGNPANAITIENRTPNNHGKHGQTGPQLPAGRR